MYIDPLQIRHTQPRIGVYLVESNGKLLHVRRLIGALSTLRKEDRMENGRTLSLQVFELDLTTNSRRKWRRFNTLGDQALFVGTHSKSLTASEYGAQEDCIYFGPVWHGSSSE